MRRQPIGLVRAQGLIFSLVALLLVVLSIQFSFGFSIPLLLWLSLIILLLGVPHGALDPIFAQQIFGVKGLLGWSLFAMFYLGLAGGVVLFWYVFPTLWLVGFLLISVWHFSADLAPGTLWLARLSYGTFFIFDRHERERGAGGCLASATVACSGVGCLERGACGAY